MTEQLTGRTVLVRSSRGVVERVVVTDYGDDIAVGRVTELARARAEGREPATVGFRKRDIVGGGARGE